MRLFLLGRGTSLTSPRLISAAIASKRSRPSCPAELRMPDCITHHRHVSSSLPLHASQAHLRCFSSHCLVTDSRVRSNLPRGLARAYISPNGNKTAPNAACTTNHKISCMHGHPHRKQHHNQTLQDTAPRFLKPAILGVLRHVCLPPMMKSLQYRWWVTRQCDDADFKASSFRYRNLHFSQRSRRHYGITTSDIADEPSPLQIVVQRR